MPKAWKDIFDKREINDIEYSITYKQHFNRITPGHNLRMIIAKMADLLDMAEMVIYKPAVEDDPDVIIHYGRLEADEKWEWTEIVKEAATKEPFELTKENFERVIPGPLEKDIEEPDDAFQRIFSQIGSMENRTIDKE